MELNFVCVLKDVVTCNGFPVDASIQIMMKHLSSHFLNKKLHWLNYPYMILHIDYIDVINILNFTLFEYADSIHRRLTLDVCQLLTSGLRRRWLKDNRFLFLREARTFGRIFWTFTTLVSIHSSLCMNIPGNVWSCFCDTIECYK